jgi:hypothetical protein
MIGALHMLKRVLTISAIPIVVAAVMWLLFIRPMNKPLPICAGGPVTKPPVVSFWDSGYYLLGIRPFPMFVIWEDGTAVRRVPDPTSEVWVSNGAREDGSYLRYKGDKLKVFRTDPSEVRRLLTLIHEAGWFSQPESIAQRGGLWLVDGPALWIEVWRSQGMRQTFIYHGHDEWLAGKPYSAIPRPASQEEVGFVSTWNRVRTAIGQVPLTEVGDYAGTPPLE